MVLVILPYTDQICYSCSYIHLSDIIFFCVQHFVQYFCGLRDAVLSKAGFSFNIFVVLRDGVLSKAGFLFNIFVVLRDAVLSKAGFLFNIFVV